MADRAKVTSVEAIESFRANLILYLPKARGALEEMSSEVLRTRLWLQIDQKGYWERQFRLRSRELERAQAELFGARLSKIQTATAAQQIAVSKARRALRESETKLQALRKWDRDLENRTDPMVKQLEQLNDFLIRDMVRAVASLAQMVKTLQAYGSVTPPAGSAGSAGSDQAGASGPRDEAAAAPTEPGGRTIQGGGGA